MFTKWSKREVKKLIVCFVVMFVLILMTELPGFMSPFYWSVFSIGSAFLAVGPITYVMHMKKGFGSAAILPFLWLLVNRLAGELSMAFMWGWCIVIMIVAEVVRKIIGYQSDTGIRICAPIAALTPFAPIVPLYFQKEAFIARATEIGEMTKEYISTMASYSSIPRGLLIIVIMLIVAVIGERLTEKIAKF